MTSSKEVQEALLLSTYLFVGDLEYLVLSTIMKHETTDKVENEKIAYYRGLTQQQIAECLGLYGGSKAVKDALTNLTTKHALLIQEITDSTTKVGAKSMISSYYSVDYPSIISFHSCLVTNVLHHFFTIETCVSLPNSGLLPVPAPKDHILTALDVCVLNHSLCEVSPATFHSNLCQIRGIEFKDYALRRGVPCIACNVLLTTAPTTCPWCGTDVVQALLTRLISHITTYRELDTETRPLQSETRPLQSETRPLDTETRPLQSVHYIVNQEEGNRPFHQLRLALLRDHINTTLLQDIGFILELNSLYTLLCKATYYTTETTVNRAVFLHTETTVALTAQLLKPLGSLQQNPVSVLNVAQPMTLAPSIEHREPINPKRNREIPPWYS